MRFRIRYADQIVGSFLLLGLVMLVSALIFLGLNQRWFEHSYIFASTFPSASGLSRGMPITLKGFEIGRVGTVNLTDENLVNVTFTIYEDYYSRIREHTVIQLTANPLGLGGGGLVIHPGKGERQLPEGAYIPSYDSAEGKRLVRAGLVTLPESTDAVSSLLSGVDAALADVPLLITNLNGTLVSLDDLLSEVTDTIRGDSTGGPVTASLNHLNGILAQMEYIAANLEKTSAAFTEPDKLAASLVQELAQPGSSVAMLLDDNLALYRRIDGMLAGIESTLGEVESFSKYLNTVRPEILGLIDDTRRALGEGEDVLEGVKNNPLIRGGITETPVETSPFQSYRDEDF